MFTITLNNIFCYVLLLLTFTLPLEGLLQDISGGELRSLPYYVSIVALPLGVFRFNYMYMSIKRSKGLVFIILAFCWSSLLYLLYPLRIHQEVRLLLQLVILGLMYLSVAELSIWRERFLWAYWCGWLILVCSSIYDFSFGNAVLWNKGDVLRAYSLQGLSSNPHALYVGTGLFIPIAWITKTLNKGLKCILIISLIFGTFAFLMGNSRGATLSILGALIFWMLVNKESHIFHERIKKILFVVVFIPLVYYSLNQIEIGQQLLGSIITRLQNMVYYQDFSGRDYLLEQGLSVASNNLLGLGQGNSVALLEGKDAHNYYLRMLIDGGIFGLFMLVLGLFIVFKSGFSIYQETGDITYLLILVFLIIANLVGRNFHYKIFWFFIAMNAVLPLSTPKSK